MEDIKDTPDTDKNLYKNTVKKVVKEEYKEMTIEERKAVLKEQQKQAKKRYYEKNRDKIISRNSQYYQDHKDHLNKITIEKKRKTKEKLKKDKQPTIYDLI
jgi:acyl-CoA reductase-like NAD-dependent aldehyde dehydrogenase